MLFVIKVYQTEAGEKVERQGEGQVNYNRKGNVQELHIGA